MTWAAIGAAAVTVVGGAISAHNSKGTSVTQGSSLTPGQGDALQRTLDMLMGRDSAAQPYTGRLNISDTPAELTSLAAMEQQAMDSGKSMSDATGALRGLLSDTGTDTSDLFTKSVQDPALRDFQNKILPAITSRFGGSAAFGSDRQLAERNATSDLTSSLAGARSQMVYNSAEAAKNRKLQAAKGIGDLGNLQSQILSRLFGGSMALQGQEQGDLDRQYQEALRLQGGREKNIDDILRAVGLPASNSIVNPGNPGFLTSAAPGIGNAMTMYMLQQMMRSNSGGDATSLDQLNQLGNMDPGTYG